MVRGIVAGMAVWGTVLSAAPAAPGPEEGVRFLQDYSGTGRLGFFANAQDELQEERYVTEGAMTLDFDVVSFRERWSVHTRFMLLADLGTSVAENLPFSPKETVYEFSPFGEYQRGTWLARFGWNHACQHLIYKDNDEPWYTVEGSNLPPDVYYNRIFAGVGRRESRPEILREEFFGAEPSRPRVVWYLEAGGYLRSLPGMDGESLHGGNDWIADGTAELRLLLHGAKQWLLFATSRTQVLLDTGDELYARELVQLEAVFDSQGFGSSVYAGWHAFDEHPRDSKEGLVELGAAFYF